MGCCEETDRKTVRTEEEKKDLVNRLNRIGGQIDGIRRMIEEDRYCDDVLTQLAAVDKAVRSLACRVFDKHLHSCVLASVQTGNTEVLDEVVALFKRFQ